MPSPEQLAALPLFRDATAHELVRAVLSIEWQRVQANHVQELASQLAREIAPPKGDSAGIVSAIEATAYLQRCLPILERLIRAQAAAYSPHRWLWYLRRVPDFLFAGKYASTQGYDRNLAESLTTVATGSEPPSITEFVRYPINQSTARHLVRLVGSTRLLSQLHVALRYAGKGAQFRFSRIPPELFVAPEIEQAIQLYDVRHDQDENLIYGRLGLGDPDAGEPMSEFRDDALLFLVRMQPRILPAPYLNAGKIELARVEANFFPFIKGGEPLLQVFSDIRLMGARISQAEGALLLLLNLALPVALSLSRGMVSLLQTGYVSTTWTVLRDLLLQFFENAVRRVSQLVPQCQLPSGPEELFQALSSDTTSTWPVARPNIFLTQGKLACFDIAGATNRFVTTFSYPALTGDIANARADAFELSVQDVIDKSAWSPPESVRKLRGVTLRAQGRALTDIDAIGARANKLLLVSCKSIPYSSAYDAGEYVAVRNAASTVAEACERWRGLAETLRHNARGENFDFTGFQELIWVVVTPFAVFTTDRYALSEAAPGLRMAASTNELRKWLEG